MRLHSMGWVVAAGAAYGDGGMRREQRASTLDLRLRGSLDDSASLAGLRVQVNEDLFDAGDFAAGENPSLHLVLPTSGEVRVWVALWQGGVNVSEGSVSWDVGRDWEWTMDIQRSSDDVFSACFGCTGYSRIPIAPQAQQEPDEALWVTWGGKPRGSDIVF